MVMDMRKRQITTRTRPLALAYVRVSTAEQADGGASLASQRETLTAEAARREWDVELVGDEGLSAKTVQDRPGLVAALARLDAGQADALMVVRVDRLSRSVSDFAGLMARAKRRTWSLVALDLGVDTSTPAGDLMANVLASVAQYERLVIGQRTREGMAQRKTEGVHLGRRRSLPMSVVAQIVSASRAGQSLAGIARQLNKEGVATAHGGAQWHASTVRGVLKSSTAKHLTGSLLD
jgi:DNA invertase Pin-like site-specific DNA recombinase